MTTPATDRWAIAVPLLALATGHILSNAVRTLPAVAVDKLTVDLATTPAGLAAMVGGFHFAFAAGQLPLGIALDRLGVRWPSITLFCIVILGTVLAATATGPTSFLVAQITMGLGCCGMLLCPVFFLAQRLPPQRFGVWSGLLLALGNTGMLISSSPLAWLIDHQGWRAGFWSGTGLGVLGLILVLLLVHDRDVTRTPSSASIGADLGETIRLFGARALRGPIILAFCSFAAVIGVRGLWGGPWLMEVKGLTRLEAGNVLLLATLALSVGPALAGMVDARVRDRWRLMAIGHLAAGACLLALVAGAALPAAWDVATLVAFGLLISLHSLLFAQTRAAVPPAQVGKAMSAVNLAFFLGGAVLQALSGPVATWGGIGAGMGFFGLVLMLGAGLYWMARPR